MWWIHINEVTFVLIKSGWKFRETDNEWLYVRICDWMSRERERERGMQIKLTNEYKRGYPGTFGAVSSSSSRNEQTTSSEDSVCWLTNLIYNFWLFSAHFCCVRVYMQEDLHFHCFLLDLAPLLMGYSYTEEIILILILNWYYLNLLFHCSC